MRIGVMCPWYILPVTDTDTDTFHRVREQI